MAHSTLRRRASMQPSRLLPILLLLLMLVVPGTVAATTTTTTTEENKHKRSPVHKHRHAARRRTLDVKTPEARRDLSAKRMYIQSLSSSTSTAPAQTYALKVGGVRFDDNIRSIAVDADGVSYVLGEFSSPTMSMGGIKLTNVGTTNLADSVPLSDLFLARIGRGGVVDWVQGWGGELNEFAGDLVVDSTGTKLYVVGGYESSEFFLGPAEGQDTTALYRDAPGMDDEYVDDDEEMEEGAEKGVGHTMFFAEVDARTKVVTWAYDYGEGMGVAVASDEVQVCMVGSYSSWELVGYSADDDDEEMEMAEKAHMDTYLACMATSDGSETWTRNFAGNGNDVPTDLVMEDPRGGRGGGKLSALYLAGTTTSPIFYPTQGDYNITQSSNSAAVGFVTKFEGQAGKLLWNKALGALSSPFSTLKLAVDPSSPPSSTSSPAIYVTGSFVASALLTLAGSTNARTSPATLLKLDGATGNVLWAKALPNAQHVAADYLNSVYVTGTFRQSYAFSPTRMLPASSTSTGDMYLTRMNGDDGVVTYAKVYGSGSSSARFTTTGLALDGEGNIYFAGNYTSPTNAVALDSKTVSASGGTAGATDSFVTRVMVQSFTRRPTPRPTTSPTLAPSTPPTQVPSRAPSATPTVAPTLSPTTAAPTHPPSLAPSLAPTRLPSTPPSLPPSPTPTRAPSQQPSTFVAANAQQQTANTKSPTRRPSRQPPRAATKSPTKRPAKRSRWGS